MEKVLHQLSSLSFAFPKTVKMYKPIGARQLEVQTNTLEYEILPELRKVYAITDGISILDYCFLGLSNRKIQGLIDCNEMLWLNYSGLRNTFIVFMATSVGDYFGYARGKDGKVYVGHLNMPSDSEIIWISSSIEAFMYSLVEEIGLILNDLHKEEFLISNSGWPRNVKYWLERDDDLKSAYINGTLPSGFAE